MRKQRVSCIICHARGSVARKMYAIIGERKYWLCRSCAEKVATAWNDLTRVPGSGDADLKTEKGKGG